MEKQVMAEREQRESEKDLKGSMGEQQASR